VVVLGLAASPADAQALGKRYGAAFAVRRATTHTMLDRLGSMQADPAFILAKAAAPSKERNAELKRVSELYQFTSNGALRAARSHAKDSKWMSAHGHLSAGVAGILGDQVWSGFAGHVFGVKAPTAADPEKRAFRGRPRIMRAHESNVLPGVARVANGKWESNRLVVAADGTVVVVMGGTQQARKAQLTIPVKVRRGQDQDPSSARAQRTAHWLDHPERWVKVDVVRKLVAGEWVYEAHLHISAASWRGDRYDSVPRDREASFDLGVSSVGFASRLSGPDAAGTFGVKADLLQRDRKKDRDARVLERRRNKSADRSRRAANPEKYKPGKRQVAGAVIPTGPRLKEHRRTFRTDVITSDYIGNRKAVAETKRAAAAERTRRANEVAKAAVLEHGWSWSAEVVAPYTWARTWGCSVGRFAPAALQAAITREAVNAGGGVRLVSTYTTALSQTCPCGHRVPKTLGDRTHLCPACGLEAQRDVTSALGGTCTTGWGSEARLDPDLGRKVIDSLRTPAVPSTPSLVAPAASTSTTSSTSSISTNRRQDAGVSAPTEAVYLRHRSTRILGLGHAETAGSQPLTPTPARRSAPVSGDVVTPLPTRPERRSSWVIRSAA
jgi:hypothetical protein